MPSLTVESSLLYPDISEIISGYTSDTFSSNFEFSVKLHTEDKDLDNRDGLYLNRVSILRDYVTNMADFIEVELSVFMGTMVHDIYDYLDNIEVTLTTLKQRYNGKKPFYQSERYKAVFLADKNSSLPSSVNQTRDDLNQQLPFVLTLQLIDRSAEVMRIKTTQGNFDSGINPKNTNMTSKAFLTSVISEEFDKILIENKPALNSIEIEDPDNSDSLRSVTIPSGTRVIELPEYIQVKNIGMYSAGIGSYVQRFNTDHLNSQKSLFVYSVYNGEKYNKSEYKLIFFVPVVSSYSNADYTYKYEDKILKCLPQNVSKIDDTKEAAAMSTGVGFRISNSSIYMKKPVDITPTGPVFKRSEFNSEVILKNRKDGLNFAPNKSVSGNQFHLTSEIVSKLGKYVTLEMNNFDPDFVQPGQKCKINYESKDGRITELFGVVHRVAVAYNPQTINMGMNATNAYVSLSSKVVFHVFVSSL